MTARGRSQAGAGFVAEQFVSRSRCCGAAVRCDSGEPDFPGQLDSVVTMCLVCEACGHACDSRSAATAVDVVAALRLSRFRWSTEEDLQRGIALALEASGFRVEREVRIGARDRVDLLVDGRVGIEVKISGAWRDVERQLRRYLASDRLSELVLVTVKALHRRIPQGDVAGGKRLLVHQIGVSGL